MSEPKYTIGHTIKKPTVQYGSEDFYYSAKGDNMEEVIADLKKLQGGYPPITAKERYEASSTKPSKQSTEKETTGF